MQDLNPRRRVRSPTGYPGYPNCPIRPKSLSFLNQTPPLIEMPISSGSRYEQVPPLRTRGLQHLLSRDHDADYRSRSKSARTEDWDG